MQAYKQELKNESSKKYSSLYRHENVNKLNLFRVVYLFIIIFRGKAFLYPKIVSAFIRHEWVRNRSAHNLECLTIILSVLRQGFLRQFGSFIILSQSVLFGLASVNVVILIIKIFAYFRV